MGAASSNNVATAVADVTNYVSNTTTANVNQVNQLQQNIDFNNCNVDISGNLNANESAKLMQSNNQIVTALQNSSVSNDIQQKLLQAAASTVGSMGIGYADASNSASMFVNASSQIMNAMNVGASQYSNTNQSFVCNNSTIKAANLNISFDSASDFLSSQTLNNSQISSIVNNISQTADQKATASVEGLTGFLIALAIVIAAIGYAIAKPLSSGSTKIIVVVIVVFILSVIFGFMYIRNTPPFFNEDNDCVPNSTIGGCNATCINLALETKNFPNPPLRYIYAITPSGGVNSNNKSNLLQMIVSFVGEEDSGGKINGGYNMQTQLQLTKLIDYYNSIKPSNVENLPYILTTPTTVDGKYYIIPDVYLPATSALSSNSNYGVCTPGFLINGTSGNPGPSNNDDLNFAKCPSTGMITQTTSDTSNRKLLMSNLNDTEWENYINSDDSNMSQSKFARFVLCSILSPQLIPLNIYISNDEYVICQDENGNTLKPGPASIVDPNNKYTYKLSTGVYNFSDALLTGGKLTGIYGVCDDNTYKFHVFMRKIGIWIILGLFLLACGYMAYTTYKNNQQAENQNNTGTQSNNSQNKTQTASKK